MYNVQDYLAKCLDSIVNQTFGDIEIILINDGSTDKSGAIAKEYAKKDKRIVLIEQENKGQGYARNKGMEMGGGDYIIFVDSDDYVELDMCETFYNILKNKEIEILINPYFHNKDTKQILCDYFTDSLPTGGIYNSQIGSQFLLKTYKKYLFITTIAHFVFKNSFLREKQIKFPENILYEDVFFCTDAFLQAQKIFTTNTPKYHYYSSPHSIMRGKMDMEKTIKSANSYYALSCYLKRNIERYPEKVLKKLLYISTKTAFQHTLKAIQKIKYHQQLSFSKKDLLNFDDKLSILERLNIYFPAQYKFFHPFFYICQKFKNLSSKILRRFYAIFFHHHPNL
ncbi:hypothetical protein CQA57_06795 [Helicobacter anseris]|uniref:Glycosyltransferase 2-like domain-containing protein n=1 Tax=Helicobacter anseris TaxID=375926 RepID=A0A3D8J5N7_9HELI|nr:hypothetical protein CQA57_06795 [Helicobacter anseris]